MDHAPGAEAAQMRVEAVAVLEGSPPDQVAEEQDNPSRFLAQEAGRSPVHRFDALAQGGVVVIVGVLDQGAVVEQQHDRQPAEPGLHLCVAGERLEVGGVAPPPPPDGLQQLAVARPQPLPAETPFLDQRHHQQVVVAQDGPAVAPLQGDPSRLVAAGVPLPAPGEEVAEEDGLHLVLGEGGQRPGEALVVALDVPDDEDRQRHRPRVRGRRAAAMDRGEGRRR